MENLKDLKPEVARKLVAFIDAARDLVSDDDCLEAFGVLGESDAQYHRDPFLTYSRGGVGAADTGPGRIGSKLDEDQQWEDQQGTQFRSLQQLQLQEDKSASAYCSC